MGAAVAGLLILGVFFTGQAMMSRSTLYGNLLLASANKEAVRLSGERARTVIAINGTSTDGFCNLTVDVDNTGAVSIRDPSLMDVVVQFAGGSTAAQRLVYVGSSPLALGEWTANSISGQFEPGIFNPGETMQISGKLSLSAPESTGIVTVGTPNGVIDVAYFPAVTPC